MGGMMTGSTKTAPAGARTDRLRRLSGALAMVCLGVALLLPALMAAYWWLTPAEALFRQAGLGLAPPPALAWPVRLAGFALAMIPLAALVLGLLSARRCFASFAAGRIFSVDAARGLRGFALWVGASALLKPVAGAALSLLLGATSPGETRSLVLSIGSDTLLTLLFAAMVALVASVLVKAAEIAAENEQFV
jgi:hypothetical protein